MGDSTKTQAAKAQSSGLGKYRTGPGAFGPVLALVLVPAAFLLLGWAIVKTSNGLAWMLKEAHAVVGWFGWLLLAPLGAWFIYEVISRINDGKQATADGSKPKRRGMVPCLATVSIVIAGNGCLNIAASRVESFYQDRKPHTVAIYQNHDLAKLSGQCIGLAMLRHADCMNKGPERKALESLAEDAPQEWQKLATANDPLVRELGDAKLTQFIQEPKAKALNKEIWRELLEKWRTAAGATELSDATLNAAAQTIAEDFGMTLRETLKADFEKGGKAWAAMQLDIAQQLLNRTPVSAAAGNDQINAALAEVKAMLADDAKGLPALNRAIEDVRAAQDAHSKAVLARFTALVDRLKVIEHKVDKIASGVVAANEQLTSVRSELGELKRMMGVVLVATRNGPPIVELDEETAATDAERFQGALTLAQPRERRDDALGQRVELSPQVRELVERMMQTASLLDKHRAAVALGDFALADELAKHYEEEQQQYEEEHRRQRAAYAYEFFVARGDRFMAEDRYGEAANFFRQAMAIRTDDSAVVDRAVWSLLLGGQRADRDRDLQQARQWIEKCLQNSATETDLNAVDTADLYITLARVLYRQGSAKEAPVAIRTALRLLDGVGDEPAIRTFRILANATDVLRLTGETQEASEVIERALRVARRASQAGFAPSAWVLASRSYLRLDLGDVAEAEEDISRSIAFGEGVFVASHSVMQRWYDHRCKIRIQRGNHAGAEADVSRAIRMGERARRRDADDLANLYVMRSQIREAQQNLLGAVSDMSEVIALHAEVSDRDDATRAIDFLRRAKLRDASNDNQGTEQDLTQVIKWRESNSEEDDALLALNYDWRANVRWRVGRLSEAAADVQKAITWGEAQSPRDERSLAIWYASRARIRQHRGDLAGAEADIQRSIDWGEAQSPRDERSLAIWYGSRASIRQDRGDLAGAEADLQKSINWGEAQSPRDERGLAIDYASRASIRQTKGDLAGAEADIKKSIDWGEAQSPRDERSLAIDYATRASIRQVRGELAGAEADIKKSIDWEEFQTQPNQRELAIRYASRASIRKDRGDLAGAEDDIKKSIDWGEAQSPRDERSLAIDYASRASIRQLRGDLAGAEADIQKSIDWGEAQSPRDERSLAIDYASRARIREAQALAARRDVDVDGAAALFAKAKTDIAAALAWWEKNLPNDERTLGILRKDEARIDQAAKGE